MLQILYIPAYWFHSVVATGELNLNVNTFTLSRARQLEKRLSRIELLRPVALVGMLQAQPAIRAQFPAAVAQFIRSSIQAVLNVEHGLCARGTDQQVLNGHLFLAQALRSRHPESAKLDTSRCPLLQSLPDEHGNISTAVDSVARQVRSVGCLGPESAGVIELILADWVEGALAALVGLARVPLFLHCTAFRWVKPVDQLEHESSQDL